MPLNITVLSGMIFYLFTIVSILQHIFRGRKITADTVYGAMSVYLLLGITWAFAYSLVELNFPGSFKGLHGDLSLEGGERFDFIYYSFVTLTTLGYGDITPLSSQARSLSILQAVTGVLFTATLVARLVAGLGSPSRNKDADAA